MEIEKKVSLSVFNQEYELRNSRHRGTVRNVYYAKAMNILRAQPFQYSERMCNEVAVDVIDKGAKLMTNACAEEEDDEDREMNELNNMGDMVQGLQTSTCLFLRVDSENHEEEEKAVAKILPMPSEPRYNVKYGDVDSLPACLERLKVFVMFTAARAVSATIVISGKLSEDGVIFENGSTIPRDVLEGQVNKMLYESQKPCPLTLDMALLQKDGTVAVTTIQKAKEPGSFKCERFTLARE